MLCQRTSCPPPPSLHFHLPSSSHVRALQIHGASPARPLAARRKADSILALQTRRTRAGCPTHEQQSPASRSSVQQTHASTTAAGAERAPRRPLTAGLRLAKASSRLALYQAPTDPRVLRRRNRRTGTSRLATTQITMPIHSRRLLATAASSSSLTPRLHLLNSSVHHSPRRLLLRTMVKVLRLPGRIIALQFLNNSALPL